ncbi:MAG: 3-deoxy-D-manno-octulosonic acid kinase [Pseudomonadota bacterium]
MLKTTEVLLDPAVYSETPDYLFCARAWPQQLGVAGAGRGTTRFVGDHSGNYALRHYHRGGLVARLSRDRYLASGAQRSRSFQEWHLLAHLRRLALPVPEPVAARYARTGVFYRADILTRIIPDVATLAERLRAGALAEHDWRALGQLLARFHEHGVFHADLNAHNIVVNSAGDWYLLDFDRGEIRAAGDWQQGNLARLHRSLKKLAGQYPTLAFSAADWRALLDGYSESSVARSA